jgi:hypothetical protein
MSSAIDHKQAPYDRLPTQRDIYHQQNQAEYWRQFPWGWYVTLTFSKDRSADRASVLLEEYLNEIETLVKAPLSCLISMEKKYSGLGRPAGRVHFHMLIACARPLDPKRLEDLWNQPRYGGTWVTGKSALVVPYDAAIDASFYMFKSLSDPAWDWSARNLDLISPARPASCTTSSRARRRLRRNQER